MAAALAALYSRLQGRALLMTQNREAANDLVQGVCERALQKQALFQQGTNLEAWLKRLMRNLFIDHLRHRVRAVPLSTEHDTGAAEDQPTHPLELLGWEDVLAGIQALDDADRAVLELAYVHRLPYRDIAARLALKLRTVNTRVYRAKARLRDHLQAVLDRRDSAAA